MHVFRVSSRFDSNLLALTCRGKSRLTAEPRTRRKTVVVGPIFLERRSSVETVVVELSTSNNSSSLYLLTAYAKNSVTILDEPLSVMVLRVDTAWRDIAVVGEKRKTKQEEERDGNSSRSFNDEE